MKIFDPLYSFNLASHEPSVGKSSLMNIFIKEYLNKLKLTDAEIEKIKVKNLVVLRNHK